MNKKIIPLAALVAMAGSMNAAQAVNVNEEGLGEVLIFPYYTVEGGQDTYINVVNTTNETKAVKVRFREAMNTAEVLDFNLYLSPFDHWSGVVTATVDGALIRTADTTCTVPNSLAAVVPGVFGPDIAFRDTEYAGDSVDGPARTREGYLEVLEMAVITDVALRAAIKHDGTGVPADCGAVQAAVIADPSLAAAVATPTGGLYGYGVLIDVAGGTNATYDATAIANWADFPAHFGTGTVAPSINNGSSDYNVYNSVSNVLVSDTASNGRDAISALLMHDTLSNDYVLEPAINAGTDWVITFPTKRNYVQIAPVVPPFTTVWDPLVSQACEPFGITLWNREEDDDVPGGIDFSPTTTTALGELCYEANVLTFNSSDVLQPSSRVRRGVTAVFNNGWAKIDFTNATSAALVSPDRELIAGASTFSGLPVVGFAVQKYVNGDVGGSLSNYDGTVIHKTTRLVTP